MELPPGERWVDEPMTVPKQPRIRAEFGLLWSTTGGLPGTSKWVINVTKADVSKKSVWGADQDEWNRQETAISISVSLLRPVKTPFHLTHQIFQIRALKRHIHYYKYPGRGLSGH